MSLLALGELATLATAEIIAAACNAWIPLAVGTYTSSGSEGIYLCRFNQESGEAELMATAATDNPSFLAASPDGRIIYAVDESGLDTDGVKAFALTGESALSCMRSVPAAGKAPCYTVHVILHGCRDRYAQLVEPGHRLQECLVVVLSGELRHIEEHGRHLYLSVPYKMKEFLHLFLWPYPEPFPYGP